MQDHYQLLHTIFEIVKSDPQPERYPCRPRELILRQLQDWAVIQGHLQKLEDEKLIMTEQQDTLVIRITTLGLEKVKAEDNLVKG